MTPPIWRLTVNRRPYKRDVYCEQATLQKRLFVNSLSVQKRLYCKEATLQKRFYCEQSTSQMRFWHNRLNLHNEVLMWQVTLQRRGFALNSRVTNVCFAVKGDLTKKFCYKQVALQKRFYCKQATSQKKFALNRRPHKSGCAVKRLQRCLCYFQVTEQRRFPGEHDLRRRGNSKDYKLLDQWVTFITHP